MEEVNNDKPMEFVEVASYKDLVKKKPTQDGDTTDEEQDVDTPKAEKKATKTEKGIIYGCMLTRTGNDTLEVASGIKSAYYLYPHLIFEGECSCLFSDTNIGKSIFAVQLGCEIARKHERVVAYYDFELSTKQFGMRYSDDDECYKFPDTFYRMEIEPKYAGSAEEIIEDIEFSAEQIKARVLIIDNLSWLVMDNENAMEANDLMRAIKGMQKRHKWTIIIVAHTPKRNPMLPLSLNDLAGSRQLANFFDSIFALGRCLIKPTVRYLKQLKVRAEELCYTQNNIMMFNIEKKDHMLQFVRTGFSTESEMLRTDEDVAASEIKDRVLELHENGMSPKDIAEETGMTVGKVQKIIKKR